MKNFKFKLNLIFNFIQKNKYNQKTNIFFEKLKKYYKI